jgi:translation initiation factor 2B subunit (eIF-2B alpha/beta/delta family)
VNAEVTKVIEKIRNDRQHGACWLSREALSVVKLAVERSEAESTRGFIAELEMAGQSLAEARTSMAPLRNLVSRLISEVRGKSEVERNLDSLRAFAVASCDQLILESIEAMARVTQIASEIIRNGGTVMTCSYSSTVCQIFEAARDIGKEISVIVAESRVVDGKPYGELTTRELGVLGVPVELIPDPSIAQHISLSHMALIGADTILRDGSVINGVPSLELALAAKAAGVPFYSAAESSKMDCSKELSVESGIESGFEKVPFDLITGIITEFGVWEPTDLAEHIVLPKLQ